MAPATTGAASPGSHVQTKTRRARYGSEVIVGLGLLPGLVHPSGQQRQTVSSFATQTRQLGPVLGTEQGDSQDVRRVEGVAEGDAGIPRLDRGDRTTVHPDALSQLGRSPLARYTCGLDLLTEHCGGVGGTAPRRHADPSHGCSLLCAQSAITYNLMYTSARRHVGPAPPVRT